MGRPKKNRLIIELNKAELTVDQRQELHAAIHRAMVDVLNQSPPTGSAFKGIIDSSDSAQLTAHLEVMFTNTIPGRSSLSVYKGNELVDSISSSGTINLVGIESGDRFRISGDSLGNTTITIDVSANPVQMNFIPGQHINGFFSIE